MIKEESVKGKNQSVEKKKTPPTSKAKSTSQIKKLKEEKNQLHDQLLRKIAEFDNYKKRTEREFFDRVQNANERLITELLPALDDLERAIEHAEQDTKGDSLLEGAKLIQKKLFGILGKQGLEYISTADEDFDHDKHDALLQMEKEGIDSGKIIEEHLKGYTLNGKVIRHSQVIVAK
jgi:molecular chaperone GrpE